MNVEDKIEECEFNLNQIKHFEPEPYYVSYFFNRFITCINQVYDGIFEEANSDFGLFVPERCNEERFLEKVLIKKDGKALEFVEWFADKIDEEHSTSYPKFMREVIKFKKRFRMLPKIKIMIRAKERFPKDINQEILIDLTNGKIRSKEELEVEIRRYIPVFLEVINNKRTSSGEPKVNKKQVAASTFMAIERSKNYEVVYACETYIQVLRRLLSESRKKIRSIMERR
jgi:hypothetical protein